MENPTLYRLNVDLSFVDMLNIHVYKRQLFIKHWHWHSLLWACWYYCNIVYKHTYTHFRTIQSKSSHKYKIRSHIHVHTHYPYPIQNTDICIYLDG